MIPEWDRCAPWLQAALDREGVYTLDDIAALVESGDAMFWPGRSSALVARVEDYPLARWLLLWLAGGDLDEIRSDLVPAANLWGITQGCTKSIIIGRTGWSKALSADGYSTMAAVIGKDLTS